MSFRARLLATVLALALLAVVALAAGCGGDSSGSGDEDARVASSSDGEDADSGDKPTDDPGARARQSGDARRRGVSTSDNATRRRDPADDNATRRRESADDNAARRDDDGTDPGEQTDDKPSATNRVLLGAAFSCQPGPGFDCDSSTNFGAVVLGAEHTEGFAVSAGPTVTIKSVTISGGHAGDFGLEAGTCTPGTVLPPATCTLSVTFAPSAAGLRRAELKIEAESGRTYGTGLKGEGTTTSAPSARAREGEGDTTDTVPAQADERAP